MNFLVIGHTVWDKIHSDGKTLSKPGGLFYTSIGLSKIISNTDRVYLLTLIGQTPNNQIDKVYRKFETEFVESVSSIPTVNLFVHKDKERDETYENLTIKLSIENVISSEIKFDAILVNMITGFDIDFNDLARLKQKFNCPVYLDIHSLSRGITDKNERYFRAIPNAELWLMNIDILQCNELELKSIYNGNDEYEIAKKILLTNVSVLIVTKSERGVRMYFKDETGIISQYLPSIKVNAINKVGCGDIFGAAFFYSYISRGNLNYSLKYANFAAGIISTYNNFDEYDNLGNDLIAGFD